MMTVTDKLCIYLFTEQHNSVTALSYHYQAQREVGNLSCVHLQSKKPCVQLLSSPVYAACAPQQQREQSAVTRCPR